MEATNQQGSGAGSTTAHRAQLHLRTLNREMEASEKEIKSGFSDKKELEQSDAHREEDEGKLWLFMLSDVQECHIL